YQQGISFNSLECAKTYEVQLRAVTSAGFNESLAPTSVRVLPFLVSDSCRRQAQVAVGAHTVYYRWRVAVWDAAAGAVPVQVNTRHRIRCCSCRLDGHFFTTENQS